MPQTSPIGNRAVGYFRVSSTGQEGEHHVSLDTQRARFADYTQKHNLLAVRTFTDVDTGRKDSRHDYQEMLKFLTDKGADLVIVQYLDRFGRNPKEILRRIWALQEAGIQVIATDEDIKEELILLVRAGLAGAESKKTSERVKANMARAVANGSHAARVPYGFRGIRTIGQDGQARYTEFVIEPAEAAAIREMYRLVIEKDMGQKAIADQLNAHGYHTHEGKPFQSTTIPKILKNEALRGCMVYKADDIVRIEGFFPSILTDEEWRRLQQRLKQRSNGHTGQSVISPYLLSGIARCGHCGGSMIGKRISLTVRGRPYSYRRYYCRNAQSSRVKCNVYNGHSADELEKEVLSHIYADPELTKSALLAVASDDSSNARKRLESELKECRKEFDLHLHLLKSGHISQAQFADANAPVQARYDALLHQTAGIREKVDTPEERRQRLVALVESFVEDSEHLSIIEKKSRLKEIVERVVVWRSREVDIFYR